MVSTAARLQMADTFGWSLRPFVFVLPSFLERLSTEFGQVVAHVLAQGFGHLHGGFRQGFHFLVGVGRLWIPSNPGHYLFIPGQQPAEHARRR